LVDASPASTVYFSCYPLRQSPTPFPGSTPARLPASAEIFTVVIDPRTAALMSQEETTSPLRRSPPPLTTCSYQGGPSEVLPNWDVVLSSGLVTSESP
jgi:hypothetical protein